MIDTDRIYRGKGKVWMVPFSAACKILNKTVHVFLFTNHYLSKQVNQNIFDVKLLSKFSNLLNHIYVLIFKGTILCNEKVAAFAIGD